MTIIMRASWNGLEQGTIQNLGATEEARLIAAGIAADHTATAAMQIRGDAVVTRDNRIAVRDDTAGGLGQVVGGGVADGVSANTDDSSTITNSRAIKNSAGRLTGILCTSGTSVVLTLYDNSVPAASGRQIYSGTLSAGDVVQPTNAWFAAGCYAAFTGAATFVITTSEAAQ